MAIENQVNITNGNNQPNNEIVNELDDKKVLRKLDLHLIPTMTLLYLLSFLDRVNIGATFYLSSWYKRRELSWRVSILFSAAALAGAFGGLLAYGIDKMDGIGKQEGWRWIFYVEGMVTVVVGILAFFLINDFPTDRPKFLTEQECNHVLARLRTDAGPGASEHFSWVQVRSALSDWKIYIWSLCFFGMSVSIFSLSLFSPTIVLSLGFVAYQAQLLTTPPYAFAFITTMTTAYFSDKYAHRSIFILSWLAITMTGFVILIMAQNLSVKYFAVFLATGGISPCIATCITFLSCNISPHTKRATALAFMLSAGSIGGIISGQLYRSQDAPHYIFGHAMNLGFCTMSLIALTIILIGLHKENRRRDCLYGPIGSTTVQSVISKDQVTTDVFGIGTMEDRQRWGYEKLTEEQISNLGDRHAAWRYIL
ncbi:unnamed protein product [Rotaria sp. Silwood2]|nr:unnamed protein product [Rotaria sp. Silwood2]CAF4340756.1 unnamed protein product [Rotaria sp. Silwood2]